MESNELREYVKELNKRELEEHEKRKIIALKRIKELREQLKETSPVTRVQ